MIRSMCFCVCMGWSCILLAQNDMQYLYLDSQGLIKEDGGNCFYIGSDGLLKLRIAFSDGFKYQFNTPSQNTSFSKDLTCDVPHKYSGVYLGIAKRNGGVFNYDYFDNDYLTDLEPVDKIIYSKGNEGKRICLTTTNKPERVSSPFEIIGFHSAAFFISGALDLMRVKGVPISAVQFYGALYVQLKGGKDIVLYLITRQGLMPMTASCSAAAIQTGIYPVAELLTLPEGYVVFLSSAIARNGIDCVSGVIQPGADYLFPPNGTIRHPHSLTMTEAWQGFGALAVAYLTHGGVAEPDSGYTKLVWTKVTITSTSGTRTFVRNINKRYIGEDTELIPWLQDGVTVISMTMLEENGPVISVFYDEYGKQMGASTMDTFFAASHEVRENNFEDQRIVDQMIIGLIIVMTSRPVLPSYVNVWLRGGALSMMVRHAGPTFSQALAIINDKLAEAFDPSSWLRIFFQPALHIQIDHYVEDE